MSAGNWLRLSRPAALPIGRADECCEARDEIDLTDEGLRRSRLDSARPPDDERNACAALEPAVFAASKGAGGLMAAELLCRVIAVAVVDDRAIVAREDDQRVRGETAFVEGREHLADGPVELDDRVAPGAHPALAGEPWVRHARDVDVVGGEVEEERPGLVPLDEPTASRVKVSAMASSFQRADSPPFMKPIRLIPSTIAMSWPWLGCRRSSRGSVLPVGTPAKGLS